MSQLWLSSLFLFLMGCTSLLPMKSADLRNTSEFPNYDISAVVDDTCSQRLVKSDKRTRDEFIAQWENTTDEELVMLWLWHNGEVRRDLPTAATNLARTASWTAWASLSSVNAMENVCLTKSSQDSRSGMLHTAV